MDIKLFGYSISLTVLILIGILYLIMIVNALSSSCNREGFKIINRTKSATDAANNVAKSTYNSTKQFTIEKQTVLQSAQTALQSAQTELDLAKAAEATALAQL